MSPGLDVTRVAYRGPMECLFCHGREVDRLTVEHLISRPVADAFGIDRTAEISSVDMPTGTIDATRPLTALGVKIACGRCNNGWMNDLEHQMRLVAGWINGRTFGITPSTLRSLKRWLVKTHLVLTFIEGGARRFGSSDDFEIIPPATQGRLLYDDSDDLFTSVSVGFARRSEVVSNSFGYLVETPLVLHNDGERLNRRAASVTVIDLGLLRTYLVVPIIGGPTVTLPSGVGDLRSGMTFRRLPKTSRVGPTGEITVDYGHHDIHAVMEAVSAAAAQPS